MIQTYLTGIILIVAISGLWLLVQRLWLLRFPEHGSDDALADRSGCHSCTCGNTSCDKSNSNPLSLNKEAS